MTYEFGPNSTNPRMRRAYAHTMLAKLATGRANYGEALQAAWNASHTRKGAVSGFEGALENATKAITRKERGTSAHRGIRRVPLGWEHPKDENGHYIPLFDAAASSGGQYNFDNVAELVEDGDLRLGERMEPWYMPGFGDIPEEEMGICLYETTTEGTPLTPIFPDTPEGQKDLAAYASEYATAYADWELSTQQWEARLFGEQEAPVSN